VKTREEIIHSMCVMYREDYEVPKLARDPPWVRGMTALERRGLWRVMEQIYDINIKPILEKKYGNQTTGISKTSRNRRKR
jgi:hypothetical protein